MSVGEGDAKMTDPAKGRAIVFGGSGFLGSHVADRLLESGYSVRIFDRDASPYLRDGQQMIVGDLLDRGAVRDAVEGCDYVYNFAGIADIDEAKDSPLRVAELNVLGNVVVLEAARACRVKRFVFASSLYVFSNKGSFYRVSKQAAEQFVEAYAERFDLDYTILRYGSLFGPRADRRNNIWRMIHQALAERRISYAGDPEAIREYIHVRDAAAMSVEILSEDWRNRHLVLSGTERLPMQDVMRTIAEMMPFKVDFEFEHQKNNAHYIMTPYRYSPTIGQKLVRKDFVDFGQGLLECIQQAHLDTVEAGADRVVLDER